MAVALGGRKYGVSHGLSAAPGRFRARAVRCPITDSVESLSQFFSILSSVLKSNANYWFRGQSDLAWRLIPSALRYLTLGERNRALGLLAEFKRVAEIKQTRPPRDDDELGWHQVARHYGLPTRLLDWTESPLIALYFACEQEKCDGLVYVLNPVDLNRLSYPDRPRILDAHQDANIVRKYLRLDGQQRKRGRRTVAVNPVWNSERLMLQKGVFTLHGSRDLELPGDTPSLAAVPIPRETKEILRLELERVGVDEMTIFPELEHACTHLKRRARLPEV
ncbi:MAG TPA: FRG domain-containing protein [Terriglobales bacterium]